MPYSGPRDPKLPETVLELPEDRASRWVAIWNESYRDCIDDGGEADECEGVAFRNANGVVLNIQYVAANVMATTWRKVNDGREWLVAPVVLVKEGVLNGELVKSEELQKFAQAWNDRPFVLGHPQDGKGNYISAGDPSIIQRLGIGRIYNVNFGPDIKGIRGEAWIDVAKAKALGGAAAAVLSRVQEGEPLEVSTGYWRDIEEGQGQFANQIYDGIQRNIRPDHLAALVDGIGACSWADGCGAPRFNQGGCMDKFMLNIRGSSRTPEYNDVTTSEWEAPTWESIVEAYYANNPDAEQPEDGGAPDVSNAPAALKSYAAGLSLLGDAEAEDFRNLVFFPVVEPRSQALSEMALRAVIGGRAAQADIPADAKESARRKAYDLLNEEFDADLEFEPLGNEEKEQVMTLEELREQVASAGFTFNQEQLEAFDAEELEAILEAANHLPETEEVDPVEEEEDPIEEEPSTNECVTTNTEYQAWLDTVEELGGLDAVKAMLVNVRNQENSQRARLIADLSANEAIQLTEGDLQGMSTDALKRLNASFGFSDFSGVGLGSNVEANSDEAEELPMPSVFEG